MIVKQSPEGSEAQLVNQTMRYENMEEIQRVMSIINVLTTVKEPKIYYKNKQNLTLFYGHTTITTLFLQS